MAARQVVQDLPELLDACWPMVAVTLREQNFDETVQWLNTNEQKFEMQWNDLETVPDDAEFVKSPSMNSGFRCETIVETW